MDKVNRLRVKQNPWINVSNSQMSERPKSDLGVVQAEFSSPGEYREHLTAWLSTALCLLGPQMEVFCMPSEAQHEPHMEEAARE